MLTAAHARGSVIGVAMTFSIELNNYSVLLLLRYSLRGFVSRRKWVQVEKDNMFRIKLKTFELMKKNKNH